MTDLHRARQRRRRGQPPAPRVARPVPILAAAFPSLSDTLSWRGTWRFLTSPGQGSAGRYEVGCDPSCHAIRRCAAARHLGWYRLRAIPGKRGKPVPMDSPPRFLSPHCADQAGESDSRFSEPRQSSHEVGMLRRVQASLEDRLDDRLLATHQGGWIQPEAGKLDTAEDAVSRRRHRLESAVAIHEPVDLAIEDPPDEILADVVPAVDVQLLSQVVTGACWTRPRRPARGHPRCNRPR